MEPAVPLDPARRPGRPRDARAEAAILEATIDLVAEVGFGGLTVDAVAARAAVGKATIYRRWSSKAELVYAAMEATHEEWEPPDTGSLRADLVAVYAHLVDHVIESKNGKVIPALVAEAETNAELAALMHRFVDDRRAKTRAVFERAQVRGEIAAGFDVELAIDMVTAPVFYRRLLSGAPLLAADAEQVVGLLVDGLGAKPVRRSIRAV